MFYDPNEPYRQARLAATADALARCAEARHRANVANAQHGPTCEGCTANGRHQRERATCAGLRGDGLCQRQVYARVTLARILADVVIAMTEAGTDGATIRAVISDLGAPLDEDGACVVNRREQWLLEGMRFPDLCCAGHDLEIIYMDDETFGTMWRCHNPNCVHFDCQALCPPGQRCMYHGVGWVSAGDEERPLTVGDLREYFSDYQLGHAFAKMQAE